jgi:hypothetical protein
LDAADLDSADLDAALPTTGRRAVMANAFGRHRAVDPFIGFVAVHAVTRTRGILLYLSRALFGRELLRQVFAQVFAVGGDNWTSRLQLKLPSTR